ANKQQEQYEIRYESVIDDPAKELFFDPAPGGLPRQEKISFLHYHDFYEVGICLEGEGLFYADGEFWTVHAGDTIFVPPGQSHDSRSLYRDKPCYCRFLYLRSEALRRVMEEDGGEIEGRRIPPVLRPLEYPRAAAQLSEICRFGFEETDRSIQLVAHQLAIFLLDSVSLFEGTKRTVTDQSSLERGVAEQLRRHLSIYYRETEGMSSLSARFHLSESQLRRRFVAAYGIPPIAYRNRLRCKIAMELLCRSELGVAQIAQQVGFEDPTDFYRRFRAETGLSPSDFRKKHSITKDC
ncbi:MAG: AraC family transcriptional regulator, partial [Clostridia bacterium]|nr:AraC family transcriptional regulator [Clostridia bacterium]